LQTSRRGTTRGFLKQDDLMLSESGPVIAALRESRTSEWYAREKRGTILGSDFSGDLIPIALFLRWLCAAAR
jgi:hypothetical protein